MPKTADTLTDIERFWSYVDRTADCWMWMGDKNSQGYGRFRYWRGGETHKVLAHRMVLLLYGREVPDGLVVLHSCDTPACLNPDHLAAGTQADNVRDAITKGRLKPHDFKFLVARVCSTCGGEFQGTPQRRYCDEHSVWLKTGRRTKAATSRADRKDLMKLQERIAA